MKRLWNLNGLFPLLFLFFLAESGFAEALTSNFNGTVTSVSGTPFGLNPNIGSPVAGSIIYDPSLPPSFDTGIVAGYIQNFPNGISVVIGGATVTHDVSASFQVINNISNNASNSCRTLQGPLDNINGFVPWVGHIYVNGVPQAPSSSIAFSLTDFNQQALGSTALPTSLDFLKFSDRVGCIYDANGGGRLEFSINPLTPPAIAVKIDIKPGSFPNSINVKAKGKIPVAILTTGPSDNVPSFDASTVDPASVRFGAKGTEASPVSATLKDVDKDGDIDMILHFKTQDTGIKCGNTSATLTGSTFDDQTIKGTDSIKTIGCR